MQQPLTKRQREILDFITASFGDRGYAPTLDEIAQRFAFTSLGTVHKHLENLKIKGYIKRAWNRSRSMELLTEANACPVCGSVRAIASEETVPNSEIVEEKSGVALGDQV